MAKRLEARIDALEAARSGRGTKDAWARLARCLEDDELDALIAHLELVAEGEAPSLEALEIVERAAMREGIGLSTLFGDVVA